MAIGGYFFLLGDRVVGTGEPASATSMPSHGPGSGAGGGSGTIASAAAFGSGGGGGMAQSPANSCTGGNGGAPKFAAGFGFADGGGVTRGGGTARWLGHRPGTWAAWHQWDQAALWTRVSGRTTPAETAARNCSVDKGPIGRCPSSQNQESLGAEAMLSHHPRRVKPSQPESPHNPSLAPRRQNRNVSAAQSRTMQTPWRGPSVRQWLLGYAADLPGSWGADQYRPPRCPPP